MRSICRVAPGQCRWRAPVAVVRAAVPRRALHATACVRAKVHNKHIDEVYNTSESPFEFTAGLPAVGMHPGAVDRAEAARRLAPAGGHGQDRRGLQDAADPGL